MNWNLTPELKLTSVSAYQYIEDDLYDSYSWNPAYLPAVSFDTYAKDKGFTQEVRLASDFKDLPVNFLLGGFYQDGTLKLSNTSLPTSSPLFLHDIGTRVYSAFAQGIWDVVDKLELSGGVRFTSERKTLDVLRNGVLQPTLVPERTYKNWSPEGTLTYRPSKLATFYVGYKQGFKSGGYNPKYLSGPPIPPPGEDVSFAPETVRGWEAGAKGELLDRSLRLSLAAFSYRYANLQVASVDNSTTPATLRILNAASARSKGVEFEANYSPRDLRGLSLSASVNYVNGRYLNFIAPCWTGQTIAEGCNLRPSGAAGAFTSQDLSGKRLVNSSAWSMGFGGNYETAIGGTWNLGLALDTKHDTSYNPLPEQDPLVRQSGYWTLNSTVRLFQSGNGLEVALVGRNITNVYRALESASASLTGISARTGTNTPGGRPDYTGNLMTPRSVMARVSFRY
jgi:iron complex outermembrane receptor protein